LSTPKVEKGLKLSVSEAASARDGSFGQAVEEEEELVRGQRGELTVAEIPKKRESG
jgi:hypothetical protein